MGWKTDGEIWGSEYIFIPQSLGQGLF